MNAHTPLPAFSRSRSTPTALDVGPDGGGVELGLGGRRTGPNHLCPMCGAYSPRSCDLEEECGGACPWVESGQYERDCDLADDEDEGDGFDATPPTSRNHPLPLAASAVPSTLTGGAQS